jgi:hypothetical protein
MSGCCEHGNGAPYKQGMSCTAEILSTFRIIPYNVTSVNDSRILIYQLQLILQDYILQMPEARTCSLCVNRKVLGLLRLL